MAHPPKQRYFGQPIHTVLSILLWISSAYYFWKQFLRSQRIFSLSNKLNISKLGEALFNHEREMYNEYMKIHIFELRTMIWTEIWLIIAVIHTSSWIAKLKPEKKKEIRAERDSNPWPLRYRCSALPTELSSHFVNSQYTRRRWRIHRGYYTVARSYVRMSRTISHEWAQRTSTILFLPREHKIQIFELTGNVLFII